MLSKHCFGKKMLILSYFFLFLLINISVVEVLGVDKFSRDDFPPDFVFGSGTSAYQVCLLINGFIHSFQFFLKHSFIKEKKNSAICLVISLLKVVKN